MNASLAIFILKQKSLSCLPPTTLIFFQSQEDIKFCLEKYLIPCLAHFQNRDKNYVQSELDDKRFFHYLYYERAKDYHTVFETASK